MYIRTYTYAHTVHTYVLYVVKYECRTEGGPSSPHHWLLAVVSRRRRLRVETQIVSCKQNKQKQTSNNSIHMGGTEPQNTYDLYTNMYMQINKQVNINKQISKSSSYYIGNLKTV